MIDSQITIFNDDDIPENPYITQQIKDTEARIARYDKYLRNVFWANFETRIEKIMDDYKDSKDSIETGDMPDSAKKTLAKFNSLFKK